MSGPISRRQLGQYAAPVAGTVALGAYYSARPRPARGLPRVGALEVAADDPVWRVLNRGAFGPAPGDVERVRAIGADAFVEEQLAPEAIEESPALGDALARLETLSLDAAEARDAELADREDDVVAPALRALLQLPGPDGSAGAASSELARAAVLRAALSRRQLYEVMVEFWTDHFSIDQGKGACAWLKTVDDRAIRRHALGNFRDLLAASARSPAMLVYLDNTLNVWRPGAAGPGNENYARELLELHTLGAGGGYSLRDVQEVARCLTGHGVRSGSGVWPGEFAFDAAGHDPGPKTVLGGAIAGGLGERDGEEVVDRLARHPGTAAFIALKLCRRFVADDPPAGLVGRVADVFRRTGGAVRPTLSALLHDPEFQRGGGRKLKRPFDFVVSALRGAAAETDGAAPLDHLALMAHHPFRHPLPDGYPDRTDAWKGGVLGRWNFAAALASDGLPGTRVDVPALVEATGERDPQGVCRALCRALLGRPLPGPQLAAVLRFAEGAAPAEAARRCLALVVAAPEFQWR